ncbi:MAG: 5-bromo-4-chloroindolyl phosphate hydrolysis family protein [Pseudomonadota bacterium]
MADRFGGKFSPDPNVQGPTPFQDRAPQKKRGRANLLFFAGLPLLFTAFGDGPFELARHLAAFASIALSAWLTREGLEAEEAYSARTIARRPGVPRKIFGAGLVALGVFLASSGTAGPIGAFVYGAIALGLHLGAFGLDPLRDKGNDSVDDFQSDRVARAVDEAEQHLAAMLTAIRSVNDRELLARVEKFQSTARAMFRAIESDPSELGAARRYLGVYLLGAREASEKFAALFSRNRDQAARADYLALLDDLETNFITQTGQAQLAGKTDLNIEISVLRERLQREGVSAK